MVICSRDSFDVVMGLVQDGMFSVDAEGAVWRHKIRTIWGYRDVPARRADHILPVGYRYVSVTVDRKQIAVPAHRVVWTALNGPIPEGLEINHKDGNKANNRPSRNCENFALQNKQLIKGDTE